MKLYIGKYGCLEDKTVEFKPGLSIVTGANGAGKSTLLEALLWSFYGDARTRMADAQVEAEWEGINSFRSTEEGKATFMLTINGKRHSGVREGAAVLADHGFPGLKMLLATVWSKQGELGFISLSPLDRRRFISDVLELSKWDDVRKRVKERLTAVDKELAKTRGQLESNEQERERKVNLVEQLEPLASLAKSTPEPTLPPKVDTFSLDRLWKEHAEITTKIEQRESLLTKIPPLVDDVYIDGFYLELEEAEEGIGRANAQQADIRELEAQLARAVKAQETLEGIPCIETDFPHSCRFVKDAAASVADIDGIRSNVTSLSDKVNKERALWTSKRTKAQEEINKLEAQNTARKQAERKLELIDEAIARLPGVESEIERLQNIAKARTPELLEAHKAWVDSSKYIIRIEGALADIKEYERQQETLTKQVESLEEAQNYLNLMDKDFSPKGVPGYLVESALPQLADSANAYLRHFTDDYSMRFSMVREKVSGGQSETLDILVTKGGEEILIEGCSGGERVMVDIALRMALRDFIVARGTHLPDLLVLDETLAPLDEGNRMRFMQTFLSLTGVERVILISHVSDVRELPGHVISL